MNDIDPIVLAVVTDSPIIRRGLAAVLQPHAQHLDIQWLAETPSATAPEQFDVILLDVLGSVGPVASVRDARLTGAAVLVMAPSHLREALALDDAAVRFIPKAARGDEIVAAIMSAARTGSGRPAAWLGQSEGLTSRESEVVGLIMAGLSNSAIADRLDLSTNSVKSYVRRAYRAIGATGRADAVLWGVQRGFETADVDSSVGPVAEPTVRARRTA